MADARNKLSRIISDLEDGKKVLLTKHGRPVVYLVHPSMVRRLERTPITKLNPPGIPGVHARSA